jgi:pyruvate dehydrogenase E2 component (dihydrolipoamide acetyltransferase)
MAFSVVMPALEMAQETGKLVAWRKKEGESVAKGEPLLEVETDKAVLEVEAPVDGILSRVSVQEGAVVPVGETIAWIIRPGENAPEHKPVGSARASTGVTAPEVHSQRAESDSRGQRMSPKAKRMAKERGIDVQHLHGSGPDGALLAADIAAAKAETGQFETPHAVGRLMAQRTTESWTSVPHFFVAREVNASALVGARDRWKSEARITLTDVLVAAVGQTLPKHKRVNASWAGEKIHLNSKVNVGIAVAVDDGVVAAVIRDADRSDLATIAARRHELTERARAGRLHPDDISGATFTLSNLGMYEVDAFSAIINAPQAAILAVGSVQDRVVAENSRPEVRAMMTLTLSCDHRVVDGARAALFMKDLVEKLREPEKWLR